MIKTFDHQSSEIVSNWGSNLHWIEACDERKIKCSMEFPAFSPKLLKILLQNQSKIHTHTLIRCAKMFQLIENVKTYSAKLKISFFVEKLHLK